MDDASRSEHARALGSLPKRREEHRCVICGAVFVGAGRALYCSPAHKQQAYYRRQRQRASPTKLPEATLDSPLQS